MKKTSLFILMIFICNMNIPVHADNKTESKSVKKTGKFHDVICGEGKRYPGHLQGICTDNKNRIYWSFTTQMVMTDAEGKILKEVPAVSHHGDPCYHDGKVYVATNLGRFNDPAGKADSWVYIYKASDLSFISRHEVKEVFHGAGGMSVQDGHFFVIGGLPHEIDENYVYEYDEQLKFIKRHVIPGHTHIGIQTAAFAHGKWWFGCYGTPRILLVTDANFKEIGRYEVDCSLGIVGVSGGKLMVGTGSFKKGEGNDGRVKIVKPETLMK